MSSTKAYRYFVKSRFYGWREVSAEQYARFVDVIRKGATAMTAEKKEEYIKTVTKFMEPYQSRNINLGKYSL